MLLKTCSLIDAVQHHVVLLPEDAPYKKFGATTLHGYVKVRQLLLRLEGKQEVHAKACHLPYTLIEGA